jgi:archaellum component FlaF (FlaF/FlaG flagellin family)
MRLVIILSVAGAATVMLGAILVVLGTAMRLVTKHLARGT